MFYRMILGDPLDTEGESGREVEGLFTAEEIEAVRERYCSLPQTTGVIFARPACGNCDDCSHGEICNR